MNIIFLLLLQKIIYTSGSMTNILQDMERDTDLENLMIQIINTLMKRNDFNCVAFVCDEVYLKVLQHTNERVMGFPYFMAVVAENEDLLSPNYDTLEVLRQVRRAGCSLYIIFMANGFQISRLFIFGDKYRIIDTRANFIILHDFRLFRKEMHYIWKRIVNVVFIRNHGNKDKSRQNWFDLTTVPFPVPILNILIPKRLDTWRNGRFYRNTRLFEDKTADLKEQILNVVYLDHMPAVSVTKYSNSTKIDGLEIQILHTLAKIMNFVPKLYEPENVDLHRWGQEQLNGSFSGLLGEMVNGKADLALGNLQYSAYHLQLTDLSIPYISQCFTFLTPEALTDNSWKTLILPFQLYMWITVLLVFLVTGFIFFFLSNYYLNLINFYSGKSKREVIFIKGRKQMKRQIDGETLGLFQFSEIVNSFLYSYGMLLLVSLPKLPVGWSIRVFTGWYWLYCILVIVAYRASLTAILANPAPRVTIDTLEELINSKIKCGGWGIQTKNFFQTSNDDISQQIGEKFELTNKPDDAVRKVAQGKFAFYGDSDYLKYLSVKRQNIIHNNKDIKSQMENDTIATNETNIEKNTVERSLHIMEDCVVSMPISIGLQKNSPLKPRADKYLRRIIEVGLVEKWLNDAMAPIKNAEITSEENVKALMNLQKLYGAYVALGIGYIISLMCLFLENLYWYMVVKKDPNFDKYAMDKFYSK